MSRLRTRRKFVESTVIPIAAALGRISGPNAVIVGDSTPPTVPTSLQTIQLSATSVHFGWTASTDAGSGVAGYRIYVNGANTPLAETQAAEYTATGLTQDVAVTFRVSAFDQQGNESAQSDPLTATPVAWGTVPNVSFTQGVASVFDFSTYAPAGSDSYIFGTAGQTNVPNTTRIAELAAIGVTLDSPNRRIVYSGSGPDGSYTSNRLEDIDSTTAAADWAARTSGPGVVWFHNFDSAAEVNAFRWSGGYAGGNDPLAVAPGASNVAWVSSGGADGGGYMQLTRPAGNGSNIDTRYWHRPFNPLTGASNGRGQDDPGANGTIAPQTFIATNGGSQLYNWGVPSNPKSGWYGHASDQNNFYDGTDFYVQIRVMADPRRTTPGNIQVGKFTSFTTTVNSYTNQELVTYAGYWSGAASIGMPNIHNVYQGYNYTPLADVSTGTRNPISPQWSYSGGWDTLLYHVTPGRDGVNETRYEVWAAHAGETSYTKIWDATYAAHYDGGANSSGAVARPGWNAMLCWIYHNGATMSEFWQRFDQIIFSKAFIACPQA